MTKQQTYQDLEREAATKKMAGKPETVRPMFEVVVGIILMIVLVGFYAFVITGIRDNQ